jgi:hypothetical protein
MAKIKKIINKVILTAAGIILASFSSCNIFGPDKPIFENDEFRIQVDSLDAVKSLNDTLIIRFWGIIGNDSCKKFWHFQSYRQTHKLDITLWGHTEVSSGGSCNSGKVNLDGLQYRVHPVEPGDFEIVVNQPNGPPLIRIKTIN